MKKNKKYTKAIVISVSIIVISSLVLVYNIYKPEITVLLELNELKDNNSEKYYYITRDNDRKEIIIPNDSDIDDIIDLLKENGELKGVKQFKALADVKKYTNNIVSGTIILEGRYDIFSLINALKIKKRETINLQIPENIRLIEDMIILIEDSLGYERGELKSYLDTSNFLQINDLTMETLPSFFIPNTYELYSNMSIEYFLNRMNKEHQDFWNKDRVRKCDSLGITKIEVSIIASIVEEEQDKRLDERPIIAGVYLNRLNNPGIFPFLQADPTVKFANNDFEIKQVLIKHRIIDNPYNTYKYPGLPPGPICMPSINAIDAVLNAKKHDYYFMCAGSKGDGYHKFTSSLDDHNKNKKKYKNFQGFR